jgi:acylphosphatase
MSESIRAAHVRIEGRVQGVGYRAWTRRTASSLGLDGWVRNRRDGSVEAHFQGPDEAVAAMIARCRQGPSAADVTQVLYSAAEPGVFGGFEMRETA